MKNKEFFAQFGKVNLQLDTTTGLERWYHVLPYGEISYDGDVWDVTSGVMDNIYNNLRKYIDVGGMPVVLSGFHSEYNEDKDFYGVGFVVATELLYEDKEDKKAGLWVKAEIKNKFTAQRVETGELRSCSGGFINWPIELAKTGEVLEGWRLDHLTLTNSPRITWLDKNRAEFSEKTTTAKIIELMQSFVGIKKKKDKPPKSEHENNNINDGADMEKENELLLQERKKTVELADKLKANEAVTKQLTERLKVFEDAQKVAEDKLYESKLKECVEKNLIPAGKADEYRTNKLDLATLDVILSNYDPKNFLESALLTDEAKLHSDLKKKMNAAHGIEEEK